MTDIAFDQALRRALRDVMEEDYRAATQYAAALEPAFSPRYLRRREKLFLDPFGTARRAGRTVWQRVARAAAMLAVTVSLLFGTLWAIPEARAAIAELYQVWREDHVEFHFHWEDAREELDYEALTDRLIRDYRLALLDESLLPEGFTDVSGQYIGEAALEDASGQVETVPWRNILVFESDEGASIFANYSITGDLDSELSVNTENVDIYERVIDGVTYHVFAYPEPDDLHILVWTDAELPVHYTLAFPSRFSAETALAFARSIRLVEDAQNP